MKKNFKFFAYAILLIAFTITMIEASVQASDQIIRSVGTKIVEKQYRFDLNRFTFQESNRVTLLNIEVPSSAWLTSQDRVWMSGGWNYDRYKVTKYYESDLGFH